MILEMQDNGSDPVVADKKLTLQANASRWSIDLQEA